MYKAVATGYIEVVVVAPCSGSECTYRYKYFSTLLSGTALVKGECGSCGVYKASTVGLAYKPAELCIDSFTGGAPAESTRL